MPYCSEQDIIDRLSATGIRYPLDDDNDATYEAADTALVVAIIAEIDAEIDAYIQGLFASTVPLQGNVWLKVRSVDLACERLCQRKGQAAPASIVACAERSLELLDKVRTRELRIPNAVYPYDVLDPTLRLAGRPRVFNVE